jgi:predicted ATPase
VRRLDGIALAIELAAARIAAMLARHRDIGVTRRHDRRLAQTVHDGRV